MAKFKVILTAKEVNNCPSVRTGDQSTFQYPSFIGESQILPCGTCLSAFMPFLVGLSQGLKFPELEQDNRMFLQCPTVKHCVRFEVDLKTVSPSFTQVMSKPSDQDTSFIIDYLNNIPLFKPLPIRSKECIIDYLNIEKFPPSTSVIKQGKVGTHLYILLKGEVEVIKEDRTGTESVLATLERGECFGEMSLISGESCSATIRSKGEVSLLSIGREDFDDLVSRYPSLNIYFNKLLSQRLRSTNVHIEEQLEKGLMGKLDMISLAELTQTIAMNQKTGTLVLKKESRQGKIYFRKGKVINSDFGELIAEDAFFDLLRWNTGSFRFIAEDPQVEHIMDWDTMGLLMEGLRLLDEEAGDT